MEFFKQRNPVIEQARSLVIYHIFIDRFAIGGKSSFKHAILQSKPDSPATLEDKPVFCGGNILGIIESLDYLVNYLGVNAIWLSPFNTGTAYHGYHITDFYNVSKEFGSIEELKQLIELCHTKGIKVIMDFVPNHVSNMHPYFIDASKDSNSKFRNWFYFQKDGSYLCFFDVKELPKLNLDFPECRDHVTNAALYWLDMGIDILRLDHVIGPSHTFWYHFQSAVKKKKKTALLIGEVWYDEPHPTSDNTILMDNKRIIYWISKIFRIDLCTLAMTRYVNILDGVVDFKFRGLLIDYLKSFKKAEGSGIIKWVKRLYAKILFKSKLSLHNMLFPKHFLLCAFLDNHDLNRILFDLDNDLPLLKLAANILFQQRQPIILYYGTEIGMTQQRSIWGIPYGDLHTRKMMHWHPAEQDVELKRFFRALISQRTGRFK